MNEPAIRPLREAAEAQFCASFMAESEPWLTLGITAQQLSGRLANPARETFVAEMENQIIGVLMLHLDGPLNGYVQIIAAHPDWRGRGLGTQMIRFAEERIFRRSPNVFLCVSSFNLGAQKLYERLGYQRVGEFPDFVVTGHAEILMRKTKGPLVGFAKQF